MKSFLFRGRVHAFLLGSVIATAAGLGLSEKEWAFSDVPRGAGLAHPAPATAADHELLGRASRAFHEISQGAMPAVVSINTIRKAPVAPHPLPPIPGLEGEPGKPRDPRMLGIGSGIIIRSDGLVLTNHHVVEAAERILVTLDEKHKTKARIVGTDPKTDLAVLQLEGDKKDYPVISFGDSDRIREGDWAIAIGSPFGLNRSVSFGIISAKGRAQMGILDIEDFIQTDAAINPGSSGGPLLNSSGQLVGVNTAIFSQGGGNMGIGFAIPSKIAREISQELITRGKVTRGWVGLMAQDLDEDLARYFKVEARQGALISEVQPNGPAGKASLRQGDVVTKFDNQAVDGAGTLKSIVGKSKRGAEVPVEIVRDGQPKTLQLTVQEQPALPHEVAAQLAGQAPPKAAPKDPPSLGLAVEDVPAEISRFLRLPARKGTLVVSVNPGSPAFDAGIGPGDIILSANRADVNGAREFKRVADGLKKEQQVAVLYVQRGPQEKVFIPVKLAENEG